jgi:hypothetical protein
MATDHELITGICRITSKAGMTLTPRGWTGRCIQDLVKRSRAKMTGRS